MRQAKEAGPEKVAGKPGRVPPHLAGDTPPQERRPLFGDCRTDSPTRKAELVTRQHAKPASFAHADAARNYAQILNCLALLERHIPDEEKREAAKALGLEHMLPEPVQERIKA